MKKLKYALLLLGASTLTLSAQKIYEGPQADAYISGTSLVRVVNHRTTPDYVRWHESTQPQATQTLQVLDGLLHFRNGEELRLVKAEDDALGYIHYRYQHYYQNIPVENSTYKVHTLNGKIVSVNGEFYNQFDLGTTPQLTPQQALNAATQHIGAESYQWQIPAQEDFIKQRTGDANASYMPTPELVIISKGGDYLHPNFRLAYKLDIYAHKPVSRQDVFVDALTGEILYVRTKLCNADVPATASTGFSGSRSIVTDSFAGGYRLRESGRGLGIQTYDLNQTTTYANTDFVNATTTWSTFSPALDQYALDAHWGAEMTYDYYFNVHSRNSIDDNGFALISYVHYDVAYDNAFWDGSVMTYGDGGSVFNHPLTTIDIAGHEITHGLTTFTANLDYQDESGALNESFSDIFGVCIDNHARGTTGTALWRMGEECTPSGNGIRNMANPSSFGDPDTYEGTNWIAAGGPDNGGVHTNSGVQNFWFYLLTQGGTGTNDNGDAYNVTGIGITDASRIAFRNLTVYLGSTSQFADARFYSIVAAQDLFGGCSPEVIATTNAWYAVGVGNPFTASVTADFSASSTSFCVANAEVIFTNNSINGTSYLWDFGDGNTSTSANPTHTYATGGSYAVTLMVDGGTCGSDTLLITNYINVTPPATPSVADVSTCNGSGSFTLTASSTDSIKWYTSMAATSPFYTGFSYTTPLLSTTTTYYVESFVEQAPIYEGPLNNSIGGGGMHNNTSTQYLTFDVLQPCTLASVWVNSAAAGSRDIQLWDGTGTLINTYPENIPSGTSRVYVYIPLTPGSYRIGGSMMNLYRNNSGPSYPYNVNGVVSITGSSAGANFYYYFYDWEILQAPCVSERVPVTVNIGVLPTASFTYTPSGTLINFTNTSANSNTYNWDFGDGNTSTLENPAHTYGANGSYTVTLIVENNGCSDTTTQTIQVTGMGVENTNDIAWNIYPNPFTQQVFVNLNVNESGELHIYAINALGQTIATIYKGNAYQGAFSTQWAAAETIPPGVYLIKMELNGKEYVKKLVKQ